MSERWEAWIPPGDTGPYSSRPAHSGEVLRLPGQQHTTKFEGLGDGCPIVNL
jgi:hypothetical protein